MARVVHIKLSDEEQAECERRAELLGLPLTTYMREIALNGEVRGFSLRPILEHTSLIGSISAEIRKITAIPNPDRWLSEGDLDALETKVDELLETEKQLVDRMRRMRMR